MPLRDEIHDMIHKVRAELQREDAGLTPEERIARIEAEVAPVRKKLGLKRVPPPASVAWPGPKGGFTPTEKRSKRPAPARKPR